MVALTVAVACWNAGASAVVDLHWPVADAASIESTHAAVGVVAESVSVGVSGAVASANTEGV